MSKVKLYIAIIVGGTILAMLISNPSIAQFRADVVDGIVPEFQNFSEKNKLCDVKSERMTNYWICSTYRVKFVVKNLVVEQYEYLGWMGNFKRTKWIIFDDGKQKIARSEKVQLDLPALLPKGFVDAHIYNYRMKMFVPPEVLRCKYDTFLRSYSTLPSSKQVFDFVPHNATLLSK